MKHVYLTSDDLYAMRRNVMRLIGFDKENGLTQTLATLNRLTEQLARDNIKLLAELDHHKKLLADAGVKIDYGKYTALTEDE